MNRLWRVAILLAALLGAGPAMAAEVIHSFVSDVTVAKDGELAVTETLQVRAEGRDMRHGIYRDFPLTFKDAGGKLREVSFTLVGVSRDSAAEPYHTERTHGVIRIYAGSKDVLIRPGEHTYVFQYRTGRQIRWFDGKPELNWNVTGNFWRFPIESASYRLQLFEGAAPVRWTAFTGRLGARGTDWQGNVGPLGGLSVSSTRRLAPGEGLTVVAELPATAVDPPNANTLLWYEISDNRQWIVGGIGLLVLLIYYVVAWSAVGRDPKRGTVVPLFHPPEGISPALANYIHNWGLSREKWRAFTAAALSLAVKGLLHLQQAGKTLTLKSTGKDPQGRVPLAEEERAIVNKLTAKGGTIVIDSANAVTVADLGKKFTTAVETGNRNRFFRRHLGYVVVGFLMTIAVVVWEIAFGGLEDRDVAVFFATGFVGFFIGMFVMPIVQSIHSGAARFNVIVWIAFVLVFISVVVNGMHLALDTVVSQGWPALRAFVADDPFPFVLVAAFAAVNGLFVYLMKAPTALGGPIMDQLDGFRLYMETAEKDRLNYQAPDFTAERFEALLPYAVALDVEKPWADAFGAALRRAHPDDPDPMRHYQPGWSSGGWSGGNFGSAVASTVGGMSGALASAVPVSSGSSGFGGGGGGSGGGGGGGGGW
ncbi:MAG TPA: DUF2207 domain-containing protein [Pseudolabrys sp.]|nr:DUF2207 domain-containing protein [Pseudolabrys sp.]